MFVEGHSRDDTHAVIQREIASHRDRQCGVYRQTGVGKGDAVRLAAPGYVGVYQLACVFALRIYNELVLPVTYAQRTARSWTPR